MTVSPSVRSAPRRWGQTTGHIRQDGAMTDPDTYQGTVTIELGGLWILQDSDPSGWDLDYPSNFVGATGREGIYLISGHYAGDLEVTVKVYRSRPPAPSGWGKTAELIGVFPSGVAMAWGGAMDLDPRLAEITLPAEGVQIRVMVNGWSTPPNPGHPAETWLLEVWPA